jgi:antitoxin SocA-like protein
MAKLKTWTENEPRFTELVLYICQKCVTDPKFGATKLNKILYYADFLAYARFGKPITGFQYHREKNGPIPTHLVPMRQRMIAAGELALQPVKLISGDVQKRLVNLREPRIDLFTAQEISLVDAIIDQLWGHTADEVSELTHRMVGWQVVDPGENIPYETVFVSAEPLTEADAVRAKELARSQSQHGRE